MCGIRGVATAGDTGGASPVRPTMSPLHQPVDICVPHKPIMAPSAQSAAVSRPTGHWTVDTAQLQQQQRSMCTVHLLISGIWSQILETWIQGKK